MILEKSEKKNATWDFEFSGRGIGPGQFFLENISPGEAVVRFWGGSVEPKILTSFLKIGCWRFRWRRASPHIVHGGPRDHTRPKKYFPFPKKFSDHQTSKFKSSCTSRTNSHVIGWVTKVLDHFKWDVIFRTRMPKISVLLGNHHIFTREMLPPDFQKTRENFPLDQSAPKSYHNFFGTYIFRKKLSGPDPTTRKFRIRDGFFFFTFVQNTHIFAPRWGFSLI